jgi:hypothetical protein
LQTEVGTLGLGGAFRRFVVNQLTASRCAPDLALPIDHLDPPISEDEARPAKRKDSYMIAQTYFGADIARQIGDKLMAYRAAEDGRKALLTDLLRDFAAWRPEGSAADVLHQRATVLRALIESTPRGEDRDRTLNVAAAFLQSSPAERETPAEWLWEARTLVEQAGADSRKLIAAFRSSSNVSLSLYAALGYFGDSSGISK